VPHAMPYASCRTTRHTNLVLAMMQNLIGLSYKCAAKAGAAKAELHIDVCRTCAYLRKHVSDNVGSTVRCLAAQHAVTTCNATCNLEHQICLARRNMNLLLAMIAAAEQSPKIRVLCMTLRTRNCATKSAESVFTYGNMQATTSDAL